MELICTTLKAAIICMASFDLGPLEHGIAVTPEKVCWHRHIVKSETPVGVVVQSHQCGKVGIYNPTLERVKGEVVVWMEPSSPFGK